MTVHRPRSEKRSVWWYIGYPAWIAELSTFAQILLAYFSSSSVDVERPMTDPCSSISVGALLDILPLPPTILMPCLCGVITSFMMPIVTVVRPEEGQSNPSTQPSA